MDKGMDVAIFGSSLVSAYRNRAATYFRGIIRQLHRSGHRVTFYEPDIFDRQKHRDMEDPPWAKVEVYPAEDMTGVLHCLDQAATADLVIKAGGVGVFDRLLEEAIPGMKSAGTLVAYWDVDAPATLERLMSNPGDPFRRLVSRYDLILTNGGDDSVVDLYVSFGARCCEPIYNALDPETHYPVQPNPRYVADAAFLGNCVPDREARVQEFFLDPAGRCAGMRFILGGSGWDGTQVPAHVRNIGHIYTRDHNAFNGTPKAILSISRESAARFGHSPATRIFEAAGAGACIITDEWDGIGRFLEPGREVLVARNGREVDALLKGMDRRRAGVIGASARLRILAGHTYAHRARRLEAILGNRVSVPVEESYRH